jgi:hypothetical protein
MNRAIFALVCAGCIAAPAAGNAREIYPACGPNATGVIRAGKDVVCIGGSPNWKQGEKGKPRDALANQSDFRSTMDGLTPLIKKQWAKKTQLTRRECGSSPSPSDYGMTNREVNQNKLARGILQKENNAYMDCVNRVMSTKYRAEQKRMEAEFDKAAKAFGLGR